MYFYNTLRSLKNLLKSKKCDEHNAYRIKSVNTKGRKIAAMTFDDGPCGIKCKDAQTLTEYISNKLAEFEYRATFNIIGSTEENYPDKAGKSGSFYWSGIRFDHYPAFGKDKLGGAVNNKSTIDHLLKNNHELANHGYRHIVCGKQGFPYVHREYFKSLNDVRDDYLKLHNFITETYNYKITGARPPHYVERIDKDNTVFDVYKELGYYYYDASFDAGGWQKNDTPELMVERIKQKLKKDSNALCGAIIYQKDGLSMSGDMPIYYAINEQLKVLYDYGYEIVTVRELISMFL